VQQGGDVVLDGLLGEVELGADLAVGEAVGPRMRRSCGLREA
jgi:hypothetical protein